MWHRTIRAQPQTPARATPASAGEAEQPPLAGPRERPAGSPTQPFRSGGIVVEQVVHHRVAGDAGGVAEQQRGSLARSQNSFAVVTRPPSVNGGAEQERCEDSDDDRLDAGHER
eukprot:scaffold26732_cov126-Isochrysis_galbana.AAC.2